MSREPPCQRTGAANINDVVRDHHPDTATRRPALGIERSHHVNDSNVGSREDRPRRVLESVERRDGIDSAVRTLTADQVSWLCLASACRQMRQAHGRLFTLLPWTWSTKRGRCCCLRSRSECR